MGQVAAGRQAETENRVTRFDQRHQGALVRLGAGVRLHIGKLAVEQALGPVNGELLDHVDILAAAVVAPARVTLGILVREHRSHGLDYGLGDNVLRRNQLYFVALSAKLVGDRLGHFRICLRDVRRKE